MFSGNAKDSLQGPNMGLAIGMIAYSSLFRGQARTDENIFIKETVSLMNIVDIIFNLDFTDSKK